MSNSQSTKEIIEHKQPDSTPGSTEGHPLHSAWSFWYSKKNKKTDENNFEELLHMWGTFKTVEGFYNHYSYLKRPSELSKDINISMFRDQARPTWESFPQGLSYLVRLKKKDPKLNTLWEELLIGAIGEAFMEPEVVGVGVAIRLRHDTLYVWTKDSSNKVVQESVTRRLQQILSLGPGSPPIEYKTNETAIRDRSSFSNSKPFLESGSDSTSPDMNATRLRSSSQKDKKHQTSDGTAAAAAAAANTKPVPDHANPATSKSGSGSGKNASGQVRTERRSANRDPREKHGDASASNPPVVEIIIRTEEAPKTTA